MPKSSTDKRHFIIIAALIAIVTVLTDQLLVMALPLPTAASTQAATIDGVIRLHLALIAFFFALVMVFMLYSFVVFRRRQGDDGDGEHFHGNYVLEIAWTVVPLVIVLVLGYVGVRALTSVTRAQSNELVVAAEGFQWAWQFTYEDSVISPDLVLPVDQPVLMELNARDVLHSFWVPEFRVKQDLVPGQTTTVRFTPSEVGEYQLVCAELCGLSHWSMVATVRVVEQAEYDQWLSEQIAAITPAVADSQAGAEAK